MDRRAFLKMIGALSASIGLGLSPGDEPVEAEFIFPEDLQLSTPQDVAPPFEEISFDAQYGNADLPISVDDCCNISINFYQDVDTYIQEFGRGWHRAGVRSIEVSVTGYRLCKMIETFENGMIMGHQYNLVLQTGYETLTIRDAYLIRMDRYSDRAWYDLEFVSGTPPVWTV